MMSTALAVMQDAITGHWDPTDPDYIGSYKSSQPEPRDLDTLGYLDSGRRMEVLYGAIAPYFVVGGSSGASVLKVDGKTVHDLKTPDKTDLAHQLKIVRNYGDLRLDRIPEISLQTGDLLSFFGAAVKLDADRRKRSLELLGIAQSIAVSVEMQTKHNCWLPRPVDYAHEIQPIIQTPIHSAFPSGHATEAYTLATVLARLVDEKSAKEAIENDHIFFRVARRIAINRTVAGVHFPVDSAAGATLGIAIGEAIWALVCGTSAVGLKFRTVPTQPTATTPDASTTYFPLIDDFRQTWLRTELMPVATAAVTKSTLWGKAWNKAREEWTIVS